MRVSKCKRPLSLTTAQKGKKIERSLTVVWLLGRSLFSLLFGTKENRNKSGPKNGNVHFVAFKSAIEIENFRFKRKKVYCNFCFAQKMKICLKYSDNKKKRKTYRRKLMAKNMTVRLKWKTIKIKCLEIKRFVYKNDITQYQTHECKCEMIDT